MKQILKITILLLIGINQKVVSQGLEIYVVKYTYLDFSKKAECRYCFAPKAEDLLETPLVSEKDIIKFDWDTQKIELTEEAQKRINGLEVPLQGLPVAFTINREIIYGFWFWNEFSSFGCDRIYTYPKLDFEIKFGLPKGYTFGKDSRFDERLKVYIEKHDKN